MKQDLTGGYCPRCDILWASPGVCKCKIPYQNTKEGIHEKANKLNMKSWSLGCSCDECNKAFETMLNTLPNPLETSQAEMNKAVETYKSGNFDIVWDNVYANEVWNAAINACAAEVGKEGWLRAQYLIRKLKK